MKLNSGNKLTMLAVIAATITVVAFQNRAVVSAQPAVRFTGPTNSQPIALSADDWLLAAVNPDNNTVSIFDVRRPS